MEEVNITSLQRRLVELNGSGVAVNGSSGDSPNRDSIYIILPITVVYAIILVAGVVGNISTCTVIIRNKSMHTATNYYLFSLAASDLLLLLCGMPPDIHRMWQPDLYAFGEASCIVLGLFSELSANATVLTITAFTVERYVAICHPFFSHTMSTLSRAVKFIAAIWILAFCLALPQSIQFGIVSYFDREYNMVTSVCTVKWTMVEHVFEISGFVFFVGPMTLITVLYVLIGVKLRTSSALQPSKRPSFSSHNGSGRNYKSGASQSRVIKMLIAVALSFFICWAPFHAQRLLAVYGKNMDAAPPTYTQIYNVLTYLSGILYFLSTAINPVLYNIMSNKFREAFKVTLAQCCGGKASRLKPKQTYNALCRTANGTKRPARNNAISISETVVKHNVDCFARTANGAEAVPPPVRQISSISNTFTFTGDSGERNFRARVSSDCSQLTVITSLSRNNNGVRQKETENPLLNDSSDKEKHGFTAFTARIRNGIFGERQRPRNGRSESVESRTISNSSLQDMDEEYTGEELATYMEHVNLRIK